jgi:hypothetical protein
MESDHCSERYGQVLALLVVMLTRGQEHRKLHSRIRHEPIVYGSEDLRASQTALDLRPIDDRSTRS